MKLQQVTLENFGIYSRKTFSFDAQPLVLIYGPNESGKTTALNGLRQSLCGFMPKSPYLDPKRKMKAEVVATLDGDKRFEFTRLKSTKDKLSGMLAGVKVSSDEIASLLQHFDRSNYEQLFGFSLDELRSGEEALRKSRLSEALAGGGLGGMQTLQQLREELSSAATDLYASNKPKSAIRQLLERIKHSRQALQESQVLPTEVKELYARLKSEQQSGESSRKRIKELHQETALVEALLKTLPMYRERKAILRQLDEVEVPDALDESFSIRWTELSKQRKNLRERVFAENEALEKDSAELARFQDASEILQIADRVERVGYRVGEITGLRKRMVESKSRRDDAEARCQQLLDALGLAALDETILSFKISLPTQGKLQQLSNRYTSLDKELRASVAKLEQAKKPLTAQQSGAEPADELPTNLDDLSDLVAQVQSLEQAAETARAAMSELENDTELLAIEKELIRSLGGVNELDTSWTLPAIRELESFIAAAREIRRDQKLLQDNHSKLSEKTNALAAQLEDLKGAKATLPIARARKNSEERDRILQQWLDDLSQPLIASGITVTHQKERLQSLQQLAQEADALREEIMSAADSVAVLNQKELQLDGYRQELEQLTARDQALAEQLTAQENTWKAFWSEVPWEPLPHSEMLDWLSRFERWRENQRDVAKRRERSDLAKEAVDQKRENLRAAWPGSLRIDTSAELLESKISAWSAALRDAKQAEQRRLDTERSVGLLEQENEELNQQMNATTQEWNDWLESSPFDRQWPLEQVAKLIETVEQLKRDEATARQTQEEMLQIEQQLQAYTDEVQEIADQLGLEMNLERPESLAERQLILLQKKQQQRDEQIRLSTAVSQRSQKLTEMTQELESMDKGLTAMCEVAGADESQTDVYVRRLADAINLRKSESKLKISIEANCGSQTVEEFYASLESADEGELRSQAILLSEQMTEQEKARKQADETIGSIRQKIEHLASDEAARQQQQLLHEQRLELTEMSEQWIVHRLSQVMLERAIDRFANDHEPVLLQYTRDFLTKLTGGRYISVEQDSADSAKFTIRNEQDVSFSPEQLSTGTREQLYLAIRMAYITYHCEHHEPLPVIMDDCFVNFDDNRTALAMQAIASWNPGIQTIVLSCHQRIIDCVAEFAPETRVIHLEREEISSAGDLCSSLVN